MVPLLTIFHITLVDEKLINKYYQTYITSMPENKNDGQMCTAVIIRYWDTIDDHVVLALKKYDVNVKRRKISEPKRRVIYCHMFSPMHFETHFNPVAVFTQILFTEFHSLNVAEMERYQ
jgi:hypothetical protein